MSMNPRKFSAEDQSCTGCCFSSFNQPYVLTSGSWTVPTGVVHQVPRSSIRTVSPWPRALKARAIGSAVIVPPKPEPTTTAEWCSSAGVIRVPPSPLAGDANTTPVGRACQAAVRNSLRSREAQSLYRVRAHTPQDPGDHGEDHVSPGVQASRDQLLVHRTYVR